MLSTGRRLSLVLTGGVRGECAELVAILDLPTSACAERRLRVYDMRMGRDQPTRFQWGRGQAGGGHAELHPITPQQVSADPFWGDHGSPVVVGSQVLPLRVSRACAEALRDLRPMLQSARPALVISLLDVTSPGTWAAAVLCRLENFPHLQVPMDTAPWLFRLLASIPVAQLARWPSTTLTMAIIVRSVPDARSSAASRLGTLRSSIASALIPLYGTESAFGSYPNDVASGTSSPAVTQAPGSVVRDYPSLLLHLEFGLGIDAMHTARVWRWAHGNKQLRFRVNPAGGCTEKDASSAHEAIVAFIESWYPQQRNGADSSEQVGKGKPSQAPNSKSRRLPDFKYPEHVGISGSGGGGEEAVLLLEDDMELSPAFYLYVQHLLLTRGVAEGEHPLLLGVALGPPHQKAQLVRGVPATAPLASSCGTVYFGGAWAELQEFVAEKLADGKKPVYRVTLLHVYVSVQ